MNQIHWEGILKNILGQLKMPAEFQTEKQCVSRGFGFVTFKHEKYATAAVQARFVTVMGKEVEIKSAVPKEVLFAELQKQSAQQQELKHEHQAQLGAKIPDERTKEQIIGSNAKESCFWFVKKVNLERNACVWLMLIEKNYEN